MAKVLYITANPFDETRSYGMAVGKSFIDTYKASNPTDEVIHIDLYKEHIPHIDADVFQGWGKLQSGQGFEELSNEEKAKVSRLSELSDQFVDADKYIFVTPLWNLLFPPIMKTYLDSVAVVGKTFKHTEQGPVGLLTGKKALHIQASGGIYSHGPAAEKEMAHRYLKVLMRFFGVEEFEGLFVEGHDQMPDQKEEIKAAAMKRAEELAKVF
ncbi:FMN-dependent NADH-azoreductase [Aquibacillus koreensis]|uniref:FMN dependent NADH:quinone oxidoreductase n=1 Tax=Aquibacillus koreensis TaxID=279446 RepID=A0A9X3WQY5_9BACI|nr:FMN-dependent NADH-azoreductase [Aquibacillus koreensis]MCT2536116.1 FMN-dependent NADH-azoreductase [Aquibacillus koreensis]MDC3422041.1 FMN-dependent NADH-azoreductase [Aquibacillus koreensis]